MSRKVACACLLFSSLASISSAQYLRASANAFASDVFGNDNQVAETGWSIASEGAALGHSVTARTANTSAHNEFGASFGHLRGRSTLSTVYSSGTVSAHAWGTFSSFDSGVGASFNDKITMDGVGPVTLRVKYSLHSNQTISGAGGFSQSALDVFSYGDMITGQKTAGTTIHTGPGNNVTVRSYDVTGVAGQVFYINADLKVFGSILLSSASPGDGTNVDNDATNTGLITIEQISGSYTSASGHDYAAVPEPASWAALGLGMIAMLRRPARARA